MIDADGSYLGKYRKHAHPARRAASGRSSTSGRATAATRSSTPRSARSASTSATTATSPRAGARSVSTAPRSSSTRQRHQPRPERVPLVDRAAGRRGRQRVLRRRHQPGRHRGPRRRRLLRPVLLRRPRGQLRRRRGRRAQAGLIVRDLDLDLIRTVRERWAVLPRPPPGRLRRDLRAVTARPPRSHRSNSRPAGTLISGGTIVPRPVGQGRRPGRRRDHRRRRRAREHRPRQRPREHRRHGDRRDRQVRDPRRRRRATPTWSCRSAGPTPRTPSRPARRRPRGAGRRRSSTSPSSAPASASRTDSPRGTRRPTATVRSTTGSTRSSAASTTTRSRRWTSWSPRDHQLQAVHGLPRRLLLRRRPDPAGHAARRARTARSIMMHAENGIAIDVLVAQALARGETDPINHGLTRPWETEEEATHRAIMLARLTGAPLYIVHMSAKQAVATLAEARDQGYNVFGETCPQYLYLSLEEQLGAPGFEGAKWVCSTPLRARAEGHQDELWRYLRTGDLSVVSTDHCPFCMKEQKELGIGDFSKIPNGIGSRRAPHGPALPGRRRWARSPSSAGWSSARTTPARMFGLYGRKGVIAPGADADIVVYDPHGPHEHRVRQDPPHEHGPLRVGGLRDRRARRHRPVPRRRSSSATGSSAAARATGSSSSAVSRSTSTRPRPEASDPWISASSCSATRRRPRVVELCRRRRATASRHAWTFDSHLLWEEPYVIYSQILAATRKIVVGPMVTNPATRDWTVTASTFATLNEMFGNRTICGIGRGDSAVRVTNGRPSTLAELRDCIAVIRGLANGEEVEYKGSHLRFPWSHRSSARRLGRRVRPAGASQLTGEVARRVHPPARRPRHRRVEHRRGQEGRRRRRPRPGDVDDLRRRARVRHGQRRAAPTPATSAAGSAGMVGNHVADIVTRYGDDGAACPRRSPTTSRAARATTTTSTAGPATRTPTFVPDEIVDRFCLIGPVDEHLAKLDALRALGVDQFAIYLQHDAKDETLRAYGRARDPGGRGTGQGQDVTAAAVSARPEAGGSAVRRALGRVALVAAALAAVGLIWTGYKAMGAATGDGGRVLATAARAAHRRHDAAARSSTSCGGSASRERTGDPAPLWRYLVDASLVHASARRSSASSPASSSASPWRSSCCGRTGSSAGCCRRSSCRRPCRSSRSRRVVVAWGNRLPFGLLAVLDVGGGHRRPTSPSSRCRQRAARAHVAGAGAAGADALATRRGPWRRW